AVSARRYRQRRDGRKVPALPRSGGRGEFGRRFSRERPVFLRTAQSKSLPPSRDSPVAWSWRPGFGADRARCFRLGRIFSTPFSRASRRKLPARESTRPRTPGGKARQPVKAFAARDYLN